MKRKAEAALLAAGRELRRLLAETCDLRLAGRVVPALRAWDEAAAEYESKETNAH